MKSKQEGAVPKRGGKLALVRLCVRALDDRKAEDIRVLEVGAHSSITDYLVIATGTSETHLRALRVALERSIDGAGVPIVGLETAQESGWVVMDLFDVMVHLFLPAPRERYGLENLWKDARALPLSRLLPAPPRAPRPSGSRRRKDSGG